MSSAEGPDTRSGTGGPAVPTCYRHGDRETYITCTRCGRPICPDCMREAAVGHHCPDCVREANRSYRRPRTSLGGRVTSTAGRVTTTLIIVNVVVFLLQMLGGGSFEDRMVLLGRAFDPSQGGDVGVAYGEWYRLLTAAFLHADLVHLGLNMLAVYLLGPRLEAALGASRFLTLYLVSAVAGSAVSYAANPPLQVSLGASGAVFGLFGALILIGRRLKYDTSALVVLLAVNLAFGFTSDRIDWKAHLGGLVAGTLLAASYAYAPRRNRALAAVVAPVVVMAVVTLLVLWRSADLGTL